MPYVSLLGLFCFFFWGGDTLDPLGGLGWPDPLPGLKINPIRPDDDPLAQSSQRAFAIASECTRVHMSAHDSQAPVDQELFSGPPFLRRNTQTGALLKSDGFKGTPPQYKHTCAVRGRDFREPEGVLLLGHVQLFGFSIWLSVPRRHVVFAQDPRF